MRLGWEGEGEGGGRQGQGGGRGGGKAGGGWRREGDKGGRVSVVPGLTVGFLPSFSSVLRRTHPSQVKLAWYTVLSSDSCQCRLHTTPTQLTSTQQQQQNNTNTGDVIHPHSK